MIISKYNILLTSVIKEAKVKGRTNISNGKTDSGTGLAVTRRGSHFGGWERKLCRQEQCVPLAFGKTAPPAPNTTLKNTLGI